MKAPLSSFIHDEFHFHSCRTYSKLWGANAGWHNGKTMSHKEQTDGSLYTWGWSMQSLLICKTILRIARVKH